MNNSVMLEKFGDLTLNSTHDHDLFLRKDQGEELDSDSVVSLESNFPPRGIEWGTPGFTNTCPIDGFLTSLRLCFFYKEFDFEKNLRHDGSRPKALDLEDSVRVIGLLSKRRQVNSNLVKVAFNNIFKLKPNPQGIHDFVGWEKDIWPKFKDVMEFVVKYRCECPDSVVRNFNHPVMARTITVLKLKTKREIIDFGSGDIRDPKKIWTDCTVCGQKYR